MATDNSAAKALSLRLAIIGVAMIMGLLMATGVFAFLLLSQGFEPPMANLPLLGYVGAGLSVLTLFATVLLGGVLTRAPAGATAQARLQRLQGGTILRYGLCEGPALLSAVAILLTGVWMPAGLGVAFGVIGILWSLPRPSAVAAALGDGGDTGDEF